VEVAARAGTPAHLVPDVSELDEGWLDGARSVGVSAGASVPEILVDQVVERLAGLGFDELELIRTATENITFGLPSGLAPPRRATAPGSADNADEITEEVVA
jgi:4-hydroxy-3-methylbut-2-en-1-yl diphosphate reductase